MEWGYGPPPPPGNPSKHAYFPLYPLTAKVLRDTFAMDGFHAGLIVSYLCLFLAMPLFWKEVTPSLKPADFNLGNFEKRLAKPDPWADFFKNRQDLKPALKAVRNL